MEDDIQDMIKCIFCGINVKTQQFEHRWNREAEERGMRDLFDLFERRQINDEI